MSKRLKQVLHQKDVQKSRKNLKKNYLRPQVIRGIQIKTMMACNYYTPTRPNNNLWEYGACRIYISVPLW